MTLEAEGVSVKAIFVTVAQQPLLILNLNFNLGLLECLGQTPKTTVLNLSAISCELSLRFIFLLFRKYNIFLLYSQKIVSFVLLIENI